MAVSDPMSDGLTKIRNASRASHPTVDIRFSRVFGQILAVLQQEGFIRTYKVMGQTLPERRWHVYLKYTTTPSQHDASRGGSQNGRVKTQARPAISHLQRVSTPGARVYRKARALPRVLGGLGLAVVSTSKGIMSEREAYRQHVGGEVICYVY